VLRFLPQDKNINIVDLGGGTGRYPIKFAEMGYRNILLLDNSQKMLDMAKEEILKRQFTNQIHLVKADICDLSVLDDDSFDFLVQVGGVFSVCGETEQALREASRIARKGACILFDVYNVLARCIGLVGEKNREPSNNLCLNIWRAALAALFISKLPVQENGLFCFPRSLMCTTPLPKKRCDN
jgi:ubiquinone/menaquinone biosynthesis C-methylase UbiE